MTSAIIGDVPTVADPAWGRSVGLVKPQTHRFDAPLGLASGAELPAPWQLVYETYGALDEARSRAAKGENISPERTSLI